MRIQKILGLFSPFRDKSIFTICADNSRTCRRILQETKPFDFGADPDAIRIQEFLAIFLSLRDRSYCKNYFATSAVLSVIHGLRMHLVIIIHADHVVQSACDIVFTLIGCMYVCMFVCLYVC